MPTGDKLRVGVRGQPKPSVARIGLRALHGLDVLLLGRYEAPDFIDLKALAREALEYAILIPSRSLPGIHNELADGRLAKPSYGGHGADGHALAKELEGVGAVFAREPVHASQTTTSQA
jgi:hypothetical protein